MRLKRAINFGPSKAQYGAARWSGESSTTTTTVVESDGAGGTITTITTTTTTTCCCCPCVEQTVTVIHDPADIYYCVKATSESENECMGFQTGTTEEEAIEIMGEGSLVIGGPFDIPDTCCSIYYCVKLTPESDRECMAFPIDTTEEEAVAIMGEGSSVILGPFETSEDCCDAIYYCVKLTLESDNECMAFPFGTTEEEAVVIMGEGSSVVVGPFDVPNTCCDDIVYYCVKVDPESADECMAFPPGTDEEEAVAIMGPMSEVIAGPFATPDNCCTAICCEVSSMTAAIVFDCPNTSGTFTLDRVEQLYYWRITTPQLVQIIVQCIDGEWTCDVGCSATGTTSQSSVTFNGCDPLSIEFTGTFTGGQPGFCCYPATLNWTVTITP